MSILDFPKAQIAQFTVKVERHESASEAYLLKARHAGHALPIAQNVVDAAATLGVDVAGLEVVVGARYAMVEVPADRLGVGVAAALREACDHHYALLVAALEAGAKLGSVGEA